MKASTSIPLLLMPAVARVRGMKERFVADPEPPHDIPPVITFERDGREIAIAMAPQVNRDVGLRIASTGIGGYGADAVTFCVDAYSAVGVDPGTGEEWEPGGMKRYVAAHPGALQEALLVMRVPRDGRVLSINLPYVVRGRKVAWQPHLDDADGIEGLVVDTLRKAMTMPSVLDLAATLVDDPPGASEARAVCDRATSAFLVAQDVTLVVAAEQAGSGC